MSEPITCFLLEPTAERDARGSLLYRSLRDGSLTTRWDAPPGAMWIDEAGLLHVVTPAGTWCVDDPRGPWPRTGTPPKVTATPSILIQRGSEGVPYHAWLRDGVLVPC